MQLTATVIRIALDIARRGQPLIDLNTGQTPQIYAGTDVQIQLGLFSSGTLLDVSGLSQLQLDLKSPSSPLGASALTLTLAGGGINSACTGNQWTAGASQHAVFTLTNSQTNFSLSGVLTYQILISGQTAGSPGAQMIYGQGPFGITPTGLNAGGSPAPSAPGYYTASASDARYLALGASGQTVASSVVFGQGLAFGASPLPLSVAGRALTLSPLAGAANSSLARVGPYLTSGVGTDTFPSGGSANFGPMSGQTSLEAVNTTHFFRVRQNGTVASLNLFLPVVTGITGFYAKIWRGNSAGTFDLVGVSENFAGALAPGTVNYTLGSPVNGVLEGDFIGYRVEWSGGASAQNLYAQSASGYACQSVLNTSALTGTYDFGAQTSNNAAVPLVLNMAAPWFVCLGDSMMGGAPLHTSFADNHAAPATSPPDSFPYYLGRLLGLSYQNLGVDGQSAAAVAGRRIQDLVNLAPRFAVFDGGNNDLLAGTANAAIAASWTSTLATCQANGIVPVILLIAPFGNYGSSTLTIQANRNLVNASLVSLAPAYGAIVVSADAAMGTANPGGPAGNLDALQGQYDSGDGIHMNSAGYARWAHLAAQAILSWTTRGHLAAGSASLGGNLRLNGDSTRQIGLDRNSNYESAGQSLTIRAGASSLLSANLAGGQLLLSSGISTGNGTGSISLLTAPGGSSGTADSLPTQRMLVRQGGGYAQCNLYGDTGQGSQLALYVNGGTAALALFAPASGSPGLASGSANPQPVIGIDSADKVTVEYALTVGATATVAIANAPLVVTSAGITYAALQSTGARDAQLLFYNGSAYKGGVGWQQATGKIGIYGATSGAASPVVAIDGSGNLAAAGSLTAATGLTVTSGGAVIGAGSLAVAASAAGSLTIGGTTYAGESTLYVQSAGGSYTSGSSAMAKFMTGAHGLYLGYDTVHTCGVIGANTESVSNDNLALAPNGGSVLVGGTFAAITVGGVSNAALQVNGILAVNNGIYCGNTLNVTANGANLTGAVAITGAATVSASLAVTGVLTLGAAPKFAGVNTTGAGSAVLGSNCPAVAATTPYTWLAATAADGSPVFIPCWK